MTTLTRELETYDDPGSLSALPRSNGELVFDAPWQGRLIGLVVHLCQTGAFEWNDFKVHLIAAIEGSGVEDTCDPSVYYRQFGAAFCRLAQEKEFFDSAALDLRADAESRRLAHADHDHDHHH